MEENSREHHSRLLPEETRSLKIVVAGAGAIGSMIGGYLTEAGADVWLVDSWREHVQAMQDKGLRLEDPDAVRTVSVKAIHTSEIDRLEDIEIVLLSVKSYDTASTVTLVKPHLNKNAFVVSCQNGMNEETIAAVVGASSTLGCVVYLGATLLAPGQVKRLRRGGHFVIGEYIGGLTKRMEIVAALLSTCADTALTDDLRGERWSKFAENCTGNPLLAVTGYTTRELHADEAATPIRRALIREIVLLAQAMGERVKPILGVPAELWKTPLSVPAPQINQAFLQRAEVLTEARSSMSYDVQQGRPTEIDALNGYVLKKAQKMGMVAPVNEALVSIVKDLDNGVLKPDRDHLKILLNILSVDGST